MILQLRKCYYPLQGAIQRCSLLRIFLTVTLLLQVCEALPARLLSTHQLSKSTSNRQGITLTSKELPPLALVSLRFRGGGAASRLPGMRRKQQHDLEMQALQKKKRRRQVVLFTAASSILAYALYRERALWTPFVNKEYIQMRTLSILEKLKPGDDNVRDLLRALAIYGAGMAAWELAGLSTIPVETAAGMMFGFRNGALASLTGKLVGAILAYTAGRTVLAGHLTSHKAFAENPVFQLLNHAKDDSPVSHSHPPLMTAFLMKFSCFPELIKNLGSSLIPVIQPWMFVLVTIVHGGAFTLLWTWLGVDTAARMQDDTLPSNGALQVALAMAVFVALVLTPVVMAWWIRDLKRGADEQQALSKRNTRRFTLLRR